MRGARILGVCLAAVFAMSAMAAGPTLAAKTALVKSSVWNKFVECPLNYPEELNGCIYAKTGPEAFFQAGKVTVHFVKPIVLQVGFKENEETGELKVIGAEQGHSVTKVNEPAPALTEDINTEDLSESEKARYEAYLAAGKSTKTSATIELAKPPEDMTLNEAALIQETKETSLGFPVMIHLNNPFVGKYCYVGSTQNPINVPFITGETEPPPPNLPIHGKLGTIDFIGEGLILQVLNDHLVNNSYASPGVQGCGINGGLDAALNSALGLPSPAGMNSSELVGELNQAGANPVREHFTR
jgi:hypothetical protein